MVSVIVIQLVFLLVSVLQQKTSAATHSGFILRYCPDPLFQAPTASCLVRGQTPIRRHDYTYTPGIGGHKVHTYGATWNEARKTCESEGGHLAIINSVAESQLIGRLFKESQPHAASSDVNYVHIGFHDLFEEGEFVTIHGELLRTTGFYEWKGNGPDNWEGDQNCGAVNVEGKLDDNSCHASLGFVCELPHVAERLE